MFIFKFTKPCRKLIHCIATSRFTSDFLTSVHFSTFYFEEQIQLQCANNLYRSFWHFSNIRSWTNVCLFLGPRLLSQSFTCEVYNTIALHDSVIQKVESKCTTIQSKRRYLRKFIESKIGFVRLQLEKNYFMDL